MLQVSGVVERAEAARTEEGERGPGAGRGDGGDGAHVSFPGDTGDIGFLLVPGPGHLDCSRVLAL